MKKLLVLAGIVIIAGFNEDGIAQTAPVATAPPATAAVIDSGSGSLSTKKMISEAETERSLQEARRIKALKAAMADKSYHQRQPVAFTSSQFLSYNRPPPSPAPVKKEAPYLVPETYPSAEVPAFKPAKKNQASPQSNNPYSYPGRVSEKKDTQTAPEPATLASTGGSDLPKKRPNFFKWLKQRKSSGAVEGPQLGNTSSAPRGNPQAPVAVEKAVQKPEEEVVEVTGTTTRPESTPVPPPSATATPVRPSASATSTQPSVSATPAQASTTAPAARPTAMAKPSTVQNTEKSGGGLFNKLFSNQGKSRSSRTISSDPTLPSGTENIELPQN